MGTVVEKVWSLAEETALVLGVEVDDVELLGEGRRKLLRVTIDKEGGVTLEDCGAFSRDFGALLDVEDPLEGAYTLEVSSPGLDRPLRRLKDFVKYKGKLVRVATKRKVDGKNFLVGRIEAVEGDRIVLVDGKKRLDIPFEDISKARLEIEL
jgi:ribosome maturation factor RimP